ncbi:MAG: DUF2723 domain-containing protein, partial [Candidatus Krumholzibacteria bacterium]|nr:DUF2723 domain-containing protein [Candidatus Krumholzibacteria bacterium]
FGRVLGGDPAHRITVMSSFFGAVALCALFLVLRKFGLSIGIALAGSVIYGLSFVFWWSAIRAEVYTLSIFTFLVSLWLALHTFEKPTLLRAAVAAVGLGLTMSGHLSFAPAVLVLGLMILFLKPFRSNWYLNWPVIAVAFIAGFAPYLYLVWADSAGLPINYLDYTIELGSKQYGLTENTFSNSFRRVFWLIAGQESIRSLHSLRVMARTSMQLVISQFVYQFSILALPVFILGGRDLLKNPGKKTWVLSGIFITSVIFCVIAGTRRMLLVFSLPMTITIAIVISFGIQSLLRKCRGNRIPHRLLVIFAGIILTVLMVGTSHLIRYHWDRSKAIKTSMKVMLDTGPPVDSIFPNFNDYWKPRIRGEQIMKLLPENSLVVFQWKYMVLFYLHHVEGMRPDIKLDSYDPYHFIRLRRWADKYDLASHPIVFVGRVTGLVDDIEGLVELPIDEEESIYICWGPLKYNKDSRFIKDDSHDLTP